MLISQYNLIKEEEVPQLQFIKISFSFTNLTDEEDWRLLRAFKFLLVITGRRPSLGKMYWSSAGGRERRFIGNCFVTLRGIAAYNFLEYLVQIVLPLNNRRYGLLDLNVSETGVCNFVLRDLGVFFRQNEDLIGFNGKLKISIGVSGKCQEENISLLKGLGLIVQK